MLHVHLPPKGSTVNGAGAWNACEQLATLNHVRNPQHSYELTAETMRAQSSPARHSRVAKLKEEATALRQTVRCEVGKTTEIDTQQIGAVAAKQSFHRELRWRLQLLRCQVY